MSTQTEPVRPVDADLEHRAAAVAEIRALADFIEKRTDLPVPTSIHAQHSLTTIVPDNEDKVRAAAEALGVEPDIDDSAARLWFDLAKHPISVRYVVHGRLPQPDDEQSEVAA